MFVFIADKQLFLLVPEDREKRLIVAKDRLAEIVLCLFEREAFVKTGKPAFRDLDSTTFRGPQTMKHIVLQG